MIKAKRLGHATLSTPDLSRMIDYYTQVIGLSLIERDKDRAFLASKEGLEAICLERGDDAELKRIAFQVAPDSDLGALASKVSDAGLKTERRKGITPGVEDAFTFTDPKGTAVEVYAEYKFAGVAPPMTKWKNRGPADAVAVAVPTSNSSSTAALVPRPCSGSGPPRRASSGSAARS